MLHNKNEVKDIIIKNNTTMIKDLRKEVSKLKKDLRERDGEN